MISKQPPSKGSLGRFLVICPATVRALPKSRARGGSETVPSVSLKHLDWPRPLSQRSFMPVRSATGKLNSMTEKARMSPRPRCGSLHQYVDAAGGDGELAPGLVVDRHAARDAFGAGAAFG